MCSSEVWSIALVLGESSFVFSFQPRRFAIKRCARCQIGISANDLVMRARELVYHIGCFTCASCNKALTTGDYFGMKEDMIYCRSHYELLLQGDFMQPGGGDPGVGGAALPAGPHTQIPFYNGVGTTQKGRPRKRKSPMPDQDPCLGEYTCTYVSFIHSFLCIFVL